MPLLTRLLRSKPRPKAPWMPPKTLPTRPPKAQRTPLPTPPTSRPRAMRPKRRKSKLPPLLDCRITREPPAAPLFVSWRQSPHAQRRCEKLLLGLLPDQRPHVLTNPDIPEPDRIAVKLDLQRL